MSSNPIRIPAVIFSVVLACSCAVESTKPGTDTTESVEVDADIPANAQHYRLDSDASLVTIEALRGGRLARLGHNHVIAVRGLSGDIWLAPKITDSKLALSFRVADLDVDDDALRASAGDGFASSVSEKDKNGTRRNMLSPDLLDSEQFPEIRLTSSAITQTGKGFDLDVTVTIKGVSSTVRFPVSLTLDEHQITAQGNTSVSQDELGLTPFSVMLGALRVEDTLQLRYRLIANPVTP